MWAILTGEFFWGIVIGLVLSFFSAWLLARYTASFQKKQQQRVVLDFCADEIRSLQSLVKEMDDQRDRAKAIFHDYLALIDVEIGVYGRNREHIVHIPQPTRDKVRSFFNNLAVKRAEVAGNLAEFYRLSNEARGTRGEAGAALQAQATAKLAEAQKAADRLVAISAGGADLVRELGGIK
jgi:hypothetical protein